MSSIAIKFIESVYDNCSFECWKNVMQIESAVYKGMSTQKQARYILRMMARISETDGWIKREQVAFECGRRSSAAAAIEFIYRCFKESEDDFLRFTILLNNNVYGMTFALENDAILIKTDACMTRLFFGLTDIPEIIKAYLEGFAYGLFEGVIARPMEITLLKCAYLGDKNCEFRVRIK